jgi:hypothetical protein
MEDTMKRYIAGITILLLLGTFSWGQGTKEPFDVKKSREELEIMKGILNTALRFAAQNSQKQSTGFRFTNATSFYLAGQGAVFMISTSAGMRLSEHLVQVNFAPELAENMARIEELRAQLEEKTGQLLVLNESYRGRNIAPAPPASPAPPAPPTPPALPEPFASKSNAMKKIDSEKLKKSVEGALANVNKRREEAEANREKLLQSLAQTKASLVETLANYGDSLTTVKPEEYINLVLITDGRSDVVSARKSWITDYKAGRLNLEGFKQKVIQYNQ